MTSDSIDYLVLTVPVKDDTLDNKIGGSTSLYLLRGQPDPPEDGPSVHIVTTLRHYPSWCPLRNFSGPSSAAVECECGLSIFITTASSTGSRSVVPQHG
ncbi:hypothetical protein BDZ89DRAFT_1075347 [Hymenopellis radicata]|nr:hypothetical protein BDZ89DRAFT_1075347 [Hymenopellis radicata]